MEKLQLKLNKLDELFCEWKLESDLNVFYYSTIKIILSDMAKEELIPTYLSSKLSDIEWNVDSMFGVDNGNGHDIDTHRTWALGDITTLRAELKPQK